MTKVSEPIEVDRREPADRRALDRRQHDLPVEAEHRSDDRRKVQRRRQIDPTTCERDYTDDEIEFMQALDQYKRDNGRMFPTCSEMLEVIRGLGYVRLDEFGNVIGPFSPDEDADGEIEGDASTDEELVV